MFLIIIIYFYCIIILLFWTSLGVLITVFIANYQVRDIIIKAIVLPLGFSAPVFYVLDSAPKILKIFAKFNPTTYQLNGIRGLVFSTNNFISITLPILFTICILIITSIVISKSKLYTSERS
jgi:ABC-2 type transport system permease protein